MGNIKIINKSTLTDYAAILRVGSYLAGDEYSATHDQNGEVVACINQKRNSTYIVTDAI